jgi:hypothetical protein
MTETNVIPFPKMKRETRKLAETAQEAKRELAKYRLILIEDVVSRGFHRMISDLRDSGYNIDSPEFMKEVVFSSEIFRSVICSRVGIHHPLYEETQYLLEKYESLLTDLLESDRLYHSENTHGENEDDDA